MTQARQLDLLLVEDNEADVELTRRVLIDCDKASRLHVARDGEEAMEFLRHQGSFADAPRPDLILLDLNMPGKDGREVLAEVKSDAVLRSIPVVILTTSNAETDVHQAYDLHANAYMIKPMGYDDFVKVVQGITDYWCSLTTLPSNRRGGG